MVTSSKPETQSRGVDLRRAGRPGPALLRRRGSGSASPVLAVGSLRMDTAARRVHRGEGEIALTAKEGAGLAVLLVLRANLIDRADLEAEVAAREVAGQLALGTPYDELDLGDEETHPVQVTDEDGRTVVVSKDLEAVSGTGTEQVVPAPQAPAPTPGDGDGDDDGDDGGDDGGDIARLARTTNETLSVLEASVGRQRRFVADASHELRSPIASLRTQLEVGAAHPEVLDVPGAVADTVRLQDLAADLLLLARLDAGERPGQALVDLGALVREEASQRTGDRVPVTVSVRDTDSLEVRGSRGQLARVIGNLLENAERHTERSVAVVVHAERDAVLVDVTDDGAGVPEEERERIFERFGRLDDARSRDDGGAGLGLAIARDVAARHGGTLTAGESAEGGALFRLRLPRST